MQNANQINNFLFLILLGSRRAVGVSGSLADTFSIHREFSIILTKVCEKSWTLGMFFNTPRSETSLHTGVKRLFHLMSNTKI